LSKLGQILALKVLRADCEGAQVREFARSIKGLKWISRNTSPVIGTVSGSVFGGWMAVAGFVGFIVVMFILTSLASPRR
jgi:Fe2+ transport system protein B